MAVTGITSSPIDSNGEAVFEAGKTYTIVPQGTKVGNVLRYYVYSGPINTEVPLLSLIEDYEDREDFRLKKNAKEEGLFTPDVPGKYTLYCYDVTETNPTPTFGGEELDAGLTNNELSATPVELVCWAKETLSRTFGFTPDTCTVQIQTYEDTIDQILEDDEAVVIVPNSSSLLAQKAVNHPDVVQMRTTIAAITGGVTVGLGWLRSEILATIQRWNYHIVTAGLGSVHGSAGSHTTAVANATNTATCITLLNDIKAKYELHRVDVSGAPPVHTGADSTNTIVVANATNFATAVDLLEEINNRLLPHGISSSYHSFSATTSVSPGDGQIGEMIVEPSTEGTLVLATNKLKVVYNAHVAKVAYSDVHDNSDTNNKVNLVDLDTSTTQGIIKAINDFADSLYRHGHNLDADSAPLGASSYHIASGGGPANDLMTSIPLRAGNLAQAIQLFEICSLVMETHVSNTNVHTSGGHTLGRWRPSSKTILLFHKAWFTATVLSNDTNIQTPTNFNDSAYKLNNLHGWT